MTYTIWYKVWLSQLVYIFKQSVAFTLGLYILTKCGFHTWSVYINKVWLSHLVTECLRQRIPHFRKRGINYSRAMCRGWSSRFSARIVMHILWMMAAVAKMQTLAFNGLRVIACLTVRVPVPIAVVTNGNERMSNGKEPVEKSQQVLSTLLYHLLHSNK
jgi:hypothetical protein